MSDANRVDVGAILNRQKFGGFLSGLILIAGIVLMLDGYDALSISVAAPSMMKALKVPVAQFGAVLGLTQAGVALGAFVFGQIGDRFGRRPAVLLSVMFFSVFTLLTPLAKSLEVLLVVRILAGLGIGGVRPLLIALVSDMAPARLRVTAVTTMYVGYGVGTLIVSLASIYLLHNFDWTAIFIVGGVPPLLALVILYRFLPESARFLVNRKRPAEQVSRIVQRIEPGLVLPMDPEFYLGDEQSRGAGKGAFGQLFRGHLKLVTPLLWLSFVANTLTYYFMGYWIPTLVRAAGAGQAQSGIALACFSAGGVLGGLMIMRFIDRYGLPSLAAAPAAAFFLVASLGMVSPLTPVFFPLVFGAGCCLLGANYCLIGVSSRLYPSEIRSGAVGWAIAMTSIASIMGPWVGGFIIASKMPLPQVFLTAAAPLPIFAVCILLLGLVESRAAGRAAPEMIG